MDINHALDVFGIVVAVASALASALNEMARKDKKVSKAVASAQVVVNTLALNLDKVKQAVSILKK